MNLRICLSLCAGLFAVCLQADTFTWDGGGTDNYWLTDANWSGDLAPADDGTAALVFAGAARPVTTNDFAVDTVFAGISLANNTTNSLSSFTLTGNRMVLGGNLTTTASSLGTLADTLSLDLLLNAPRTITVNSSHNLTVSGVIGETGGSQGLTKTGNGELTLSNTNTYSGKTTLSSGRVYYYSLRNVGEGPSSFGAPTTVADGTIDFTSRMTYKGGSMTSDRVLNFLDNVQFEHSGSGTMTLTGGFTSSGKTPFIRGAGTIVVSGPINLGSGGITRTDAGTLILTDPANAFTGGLNILDGTISADSFADSGVACPIGAGSAISIGQSNGTTGRLRYTGSIDESCNRTVTIVSQAGKTNGGIIENATADTTLTLSGNINVSSATLTPSLQLTGAGNGVLSGVINGAMKVTVNGAGTWALAGANTYTGVTTVSSGTLLVNGSTAAGSAVTVSAGATLGGTGTVYGAVSVAAGGTLAAGVGGVGTLSLADAGAAALTLNGNTITSEVTAVAGVCDTIDIDGTLVLNGANTITLSFPDGSAPAGSYTLLTYAATSGSGTLALDHPYPSATLDVGATAAVLTITGGGSAASLTWVGDDSANEWDTATANWSPILYADGAAVVFDDTGSASPAISIVNPVAPASVRIDASSKAYVFSGAGITGECSLVKSGTAVLTLNNVNAYSGQTAVNAGTLALNGTLSNSCVSVAWQASLTQSASGRIDGDAVCVTNYGTATLAGTNSYGGVTVVGPLGVSNITLNVNSPYALGSTAEGTVVNGGWVNTENRLMVGNGVTVTGETLTLNPASGYRAGLRFSSSGTGTWAGDVVLAPVNGPSYIGNDNGSGTLVIGASDADLISGSNGSLSFRGGGTVTVNSRFSLGGIGINRDDSGTLIINSTNNVFGGINVVQGTLKLGASGALPESTTLSIGKNSTINNIAFFDLNGQDQCVAGLVDSHSDAGTGTQRIISDLPATFTVSNNTARSFGKTGSSIEGAVSLVKIGTATLTLTCTNSYSGATVVSNGTLTVSAAGTLGTNSLSVVVGGTGTLALSANDAIADEATVLMPETGVTTAKIQLDAGEEETVGWLLYGDVFKQVGTYGATGSGADHIDDTHFSGTGMLRVLHSKMGTLIKVQ